jgi:exo-1,4-beta-D-glucosaminidase
MMNSAWPNLHWQFFDWFLNPAGSFFGSKVGARPEHVSYNYENNTIYLINRLNILSHGDDDARTVTVDLIDTTGKSLSHQTVETKTTPNLSQKIAKLDNFDKIKDVGFLRLVLSDSQKNVLSRNVYWLAARNDVLQWNNSTWYYTPITSYSDYTVLEKLSGATVKTSIKHLPSTADGSQVLQVDLDNQSDVPAFFIRLVLTDAKTNDNINPPYWSDNYVTLFPKESLSLTVSFKSSVTPAIEVSGSNIATKVIS